MEPENKFTLEYYESVVRLAKDSGYDFRTLREHWDAGCPQGKTFILRHDLDANPLTLKGILDVEERCGVRSSIFVRVTTNTYNPFDYRTYPILDRARRLGFELGLHTNFVEFATYHGLDPDDVLSAELASLRGFFGPIESLACHRDLNYAYNSLPWVQSNWSDLKGKHGLVYEAYDKRIMDGLTYVNETAEQKLGWRALTPEQAIARGGNICMSTHPHWWFRNNPFET